MKGFSINGTKFVKDGDSFIDEERLEAYKERLQTAFKLGGKISRLQSYNKEEAKQGQKD